MDLSLTEEQKIIKNTTRTFLKQELPWTAVEAIDDSPKGFSEDLWKQISELGWLQMIFPEEFGGSGNSLTDVAMIYEEMGHVAAPLVSFSSSILCGSIILEAGTKAQKKQLIPAIADGVKIMTLALNEPDFGMGPESVKLTATPKGNDFILNGTKTFIHDAQVADQLLCVARTKESKKPAKGISLFVIDTKTKGLTVRTLSSFSGDKLNELTFKNVKVPASSILGKKDNGWAALEKALSKSLVILCAYMVGACQHLLDISVEYSKTRHQFGQPIGAFQYVQGRCIHQADQLEKARWLTYEALFKMDSGKPEREQAGAASLAKAVCSEALWHCDHEAHEIHAGVSIDKQLGLYIHTKRAKNLFSYLGDPNHHFKVAAEMLFDGNLQ